MPDAAHHLAITADPSAIAAASAWVRSLGGSLRLLPEDVFRLDLCVSELVTNVASYGYTNGGDRTIELTTEPTAGGTGIRVEIVDRGEPFDPLAEAAPAPPASPGESRIGGLGIHLVRSLADECAYRRAGDRNVFTLVVNRSTAATPGAGLTDRGVERRAATTAPSFPLTRADGEVVEHDERSRRERRLLGFIPSCSIFRDVPYRLIENVVANCPIRSHAEGEIIMRPGDRNQQVVLVLEGSLRVHLGSSDSPDHLDIGVGECAGEMSVIDGKPVSAYVVAATACRLITIDEDTFLTRILPVPGVARNLVATLADRMRTGNERVIARLKSSLELNGLQRELQFAHQVQASMVPEGITVDFARAEVQCCGFMRPARLVGGDFYDAFYVDSNRLVVVMGDVCGKGMPAALFMARTLTLLRSEGVHPTRRAQRHHTLELVERTNQQLCRNNTADYFASVFAAMLDLSTGVLTWVNCGHPAPALARGSSDFRFLVEPRGMLMGVSDEPGYEVGETALPPGSVLLLYTDGLTEAENAHGIMFGQQRLIELLNNVESRAADTVIHSMVGGVEIFAQGRPQSDDLTLFALSYTGER